MKRLGLVRARVERWDSFRARAKDLTELASMNDPEMSADLERDFAALTTEIAKATLEAQLSGPYDERDAVLAARRFAGVYAQLG